VLGEEGEVVALVQDLDADVRVELAQPPDLTVLLGHEPLVEGGDLDGEPPPGQVEVRPELLGRMAGGVPVDREGGRLVLPVDRVEVEQARGLGSGVGGQGVLGDGRGRRAPAGRGPPPAPPAPPDGLTGPASAEGATGPLPGWSPGRWARSPSVSAQT